MLRHQRSVRGKRYAPLAGVGAASQNGTGSECEKRFRDSDVIARFAREYGLSDVEIEFVVWIQKPQPRSRAGHDWRPSPRTLSR